MTKPKWCVTYKAMSDGRTVEIYCSTKGEAERFADMVRKVDSKAEPRVEER
jgi:hypothetical protein